MASSAYKAEESESSYGPVPEFLPPPKECQIFIGNIVRGVSIDKDLLPLSQKYGKVYEMHLFMGKRRGYAIVSYCKMEDASKAIQELHDFQLSKDGAIKVFPLFNDARILIGNLPRGMPSANLIDILNELSGFTILKAALMREVVNGMYGYGLVECTFIGSRNLKGELRSNNLGEDLFGRTISVEYAKNLAETVREKLQEENEKFKDIFMKYCAASGREVSELSASKCVRWFKESGILADKSNRLQMADVDDYFRELVGLQKRQLSLQDMDNLLDLIEEYKELPFGTLKEQLLSLDEKD